VRLFSVLFLTGASGSVSDAPGHYVANSQDV
jgi:hypothetical protein